MRTILSYQYLIKLNEDKNIKELNKKKKNE